MQNEKINIALLGVSTGVIMVSLFLWLVPNEKPPTCTDTKEVRNETRKLIAAKQGLICEKHNGELGKNVFGDVTCRIGNEHWTWKYEEFENPQTLK